MKIIYCIAFCLLMGNIGHSQILKRVLNDAKNNAESRARGKVVQKTNQAIDSVLSPSQKKDKSKEASNPQPTVSEKQNTIVSSSAAENGEEMKISEGYITLSLSADKAFINDRVIISGSSLKYGNLTEVKLTIQGPENKIMSIPLTAKNEYNVVFQPRKEGLYSMKATSSDGKATESARLIVSGAATATTTSQLPGNGAATGTGGKPGVAGQLNAEADWTLDNREVVEKAFALVQKNVDRLKKAVAEKERAEINKKFDQLKKEVDKLLNFFNELSKARVELASRTLHESLQQKISQLNDALFQQKIQMQKASEAADHEPFDNSICEYITMIKEAAVAFEMLTSWLKLPLEICKQLVKDNTPLGNINENSLSSQAASVAITPAKIFAQSKLSADDITAADFTNDIVQYASEFLLKKYCAILEGNLQQEYQITYRNELGSKWWEYNYLTKSILTLRYPKSNAGGGKIIKMKGCIEGNAIQFNFYQDIELMDDFRKEIKQRGKVIPIQLHTPATIPFSSTAVQGAGAVARGLLTPAYFYIPVDAEYDPEANTIKLFLNNALIDFSTLVKWKMGYIVMAAGIPLVTTVDFPINKAFLTMNAVISKNNDFNVIENPNGISFSGNGERQIGDDGSSIQHKIKFNLSAKSQ